MKQTIAMTRALGDKNRLRTIAALSDHPELCVCQITELLQLSAATVSRHMSVLQNALLVENRKKGRWVYYRLSDSFPPLLLTWLTQALSAAEEIHEDRRRVPGILLRMSADQC